MKHSDDKTKDKRGPNKNVPSHRLTFSRRWLWLLVPVILILLFLAPNLASIDPIRGWLVQSVAKSYSVNATAETLSVGWFSGTELTGIEVTNDAGVKLAEIDRLLLDATLLDLVTGERRLGAIQLRKPVVYIDFLPETTNWKEPIESALARADQEVDPLSASLRIDSGVVQVSDSATGFNETSSVIGSLDYRRGLDQPIAVDMVVNTGSDAGEMRVQGEWRGNMTTQEGSIGENEIVVKLSKTDLRPLSPIVQRSGVAQRVSGRVSGSVHVRKASSASPLEIRFDQVQSDQITLEKLHRLQDPELALDEFSLNGTVAIDSHNAVWKDLQLQSRLASVKASGGISHQKLLKQQWGDAIRSHENRIETNLNLVALAEQFPRSLDLRSETTVNTGKARLSLVAAHQGKSMQMEGTAAWENLSVITANDQPRIIPPAKVAFEAAYDERGMEIIDLRGNGNFFTLSGRGHLGEGALKAELSLDKFHRDLATLIDFGGRRLSGQADVTARWARGDDSDWIAAVSAQMTEWQLDLPGVPVWKEPSLSLAGELRGTVQNRRLREIKQGNLTLAANEDRSLLNLKQSVDLNADVPVWPFRFEVEGDAGRWKDRLAMALPLSRFDLQGDLTATGEVTLSRRAVSWQDVDGSMRPFQVRVGDITIDEPSVLLASPGGSYDFAEQRIVLENLEVNGDSLELRTENFHADLSSAVPTALGSIVIRGDWEGIRKAWEGPAVEPKRRLEGRFESQVVFEEQADGAVGNFFFTSDDFALWRAATSESVGNDSTPSVWNRVWAEPHASVKGRLSLKPGTHTLEVVGMTLDSNLIAGQITGKVNELDSSPRIDVAGDLQYDLGGMVTLVLPHLADEIQLVGREQTKFEVRGPLQPAVGAQPISVRLANAEVVEGEPIVSEKLQGAAILSWQEASLYGLPVGPGNVTAKIDNSVVQFSALNIPLHQGTLHANASLLLLRPQPVLVVNKGRILNDVEITPAMCRSWLKYLAPLAADATRIEGKLSLDLTDARLKPADTGQSDLEGMLHLHDAHLGPGPLSTRAIEIAARLQQLLLERPIAALENDEQTVWLDASDQRVRFALRSGRVHHENMRVIIDQIVIVTSGSVGLDGSLALVAEIPIRKQWFKDQESLLASLAGQTIRIPISGTLAQPDFDREALRELAGESARSAARSLLERSLLRGVEALLDTSGSENASDE